MDAVTFSDLQLKGKATVDRWLRRSTSQFLLVRRRDAENLVLTTVSRAEQAREASSVTSRMFVALMQHDPRVRELVTEILPEVFPWVAFLSRDEVREFVVELVSTMRAPTRSTIRLRLFRSSRVGATLLKCSPTPNWLPPWRNPVRAITVPCQRRAGEPEARGSRRTAGGRTGPVGAAVCNE
jgi:hypothetical protein